MAITEKLTNLAEAIRRLTKRPGLLTLEEMEDAINSMENSPRSIDDVILTDSSLVFPAGCYSKAIRVHLKDWKWNSLDLSNGIMTQATVQDIEEGG